ncbi:histone-lysine N-methyltransferase, H3 lysine-79 specific [Ananas comosus]|uniref:Histone-lysine N-methyltransferase, H3 lysine-79 specific n=1 Tax=Ananas comosus TaxID=4615 RepID=A0A6P5F3Y7_ANACO|nr:histone-lysine N-methyltransferase, H3 lysine-79 specific [Ananas comosus]
MREEKKRMEAASEELERRSRYLSSLIQRTKMRTEAEEEVTAAAAAAAAHSDGKVEEKRREPRIEMEREKEKEEVKEKEKVKEKKGEEEEEEEEEEKGDEAQEKHKVRVRAADMPLALQKRAFRCARETLAAMPKLDSKRLALALKKEFDSLYGPAWHCIVGTSFGSYVTHSLGGFLYFSIDKAYVLLFRTAVEPLGH